MRDAEGVNGSAAERSVTWRVLQRLLPRWYARAYGAELLAVHERAWGEARGVRFWTRVAADVMATSVQLRLDALRSARGRSMLSGGGLQPLQHALRSVVREPAFAAAVVLTLGLGIGVVATMFTVLDRLLLSPPAHVEDAEGIRRIYVHGTSPFSGTVAYSAALSWPDYRDMQGVNAFAETAAFAPQELTLGSGAEAEPVRAELASASYFALLGVEPVQGRFFVESDDRVDATSGAAVLSHDFWRRRFGSAPVLGTELRIGRSTYTVVGIAPEGFTGVNISPVDVWLPLLAAQSREAGLQWMDARRWYWLSALVRLPDARSADVAAEAATARYRTARAEVSGQDPNARIVLANVIDARSPDGTAEARVAQLLSALAAVVLLISCANVANLMLARGIRRRRVLALQNALGGTRARLVWETLLESLLLAGGAAAVAVLMTRVLAPPLFRALLPDALLVQPVSARLLLICATACLIAVLLAGLLPALRSTRFQLFDALRSTRETRQSATLRRALLFGQAALSALLLTGAGMFLRSLQEAGTVDLGVDRNALAVSFELQDGTRFGDGLTDVAYAALDRIRAIPGVEHAAVTTLAPFQGRWGATIAVGADTFPHGARGPYYYGVGAGYFDAMGLQITQGRAITEADDRAGAPPVAVLSESLVRELFGDAAPLGRCVTIDIGDTACAQIVGVAEDVLPSIRAEATSHVVYMPNRVPPDYAGGSLVVLPRTNSEDVTRAVREAARSAHPDVRFVVVQPLDELLAGEVRPWRLGAAMLTVFGLLALIIAATGLYSVLSFDVTQRRYELGVRTALGAPAASLVGSVTGHALGACAAGLLCGIAVAAAGSRVAASLLFRVTAVEPFVYAGVIGALLVTAVIAAAVPAWRAVRTDPRSALQ